MELTPEQIDEIVTLTSTAIEASSSGDPGATAAWIGVVGAVLAAVVGWARAHFEKKDRLVAEVQAEMAKNEKDATEASAVRVLRGINRAGGAIEQVKLDNREVRAEVIKEGGFGAETLLDKAGF